MISIKQCSDILNKGENKYKDESVRRIRDFLYQAAELEYWLFKAVLNKNIININRWSDFSTDFHHCYYMINELRRRGVKIVVLEQPINLKSPVWYTQLMPYLIYNLSED